MPARILVIEDNAANLELVRYLLSFSGHTVLEASNGELGVEVALRELPDLIVCDLQMPRMDGYQVLDALRRHPAGAAIPIVAVTAFSMPNDRQKVMTAGFNGYLSKPIEPELFVGQIEAFLPAALRTARV
ncbi:response regulator [Roseateles sp. DC23W]|uniref:Response regulator n=1 Tax=Pelomonas dachongensis TaxID=3299029 RepID=A0ABW7EFR5_9BURK